jgi:hypothetical protein
MPKIFRDLVLLLGPPLVAWAAQDLVPALHDTNPQAAALIASACGFLTLVLTPLEKSYGVTGIKTPPASTPTDVGPGV